MGLKNRNCPQVGPEYIIQNGIFKGSTIREVLEDGSCDHIQWAMTKGRITLTKEAQELKESLCKRERNLKLGYPCECPCNPNK